MKARALFPSNDRTCHRRFGPIGEYQPVTESACLTWLKAQHKLLRHWQDELVATGAKPDMLAALSTHESWLGDMISKLTQR